MKALRWLLGIAVVAAAVCAGAYSLLRPEPAPEWRKVAIERKDVKSTVSSTGALEAVVTVEVGTQVSARIAEVLVDFNDPVTNGQILARLDTSLLDADVASARAAYDVAAADLAQAKLDLSRLEGLHGSGAASDEELETARTAHEVARARQRSASVSLERSRANLGYATISSPIDGTIVRRDVDPGQTVNAGMSAPTLFLIAGDLGQMQILASVDEADIGKIAGDQRVEFTVQAYPETKFAGVVQQVRLQSTTVENVVTYTVVVGVENAEGKLLPGMTATVDFIVDEAPAAWCVPNAALRFTPENEQITPASREPEAAVPAAKAAVTGGGREGRGGGRGGRGGPKGPRKLWVVGPDELLAPLVVEVGLSDGTCTEIKGEALAEGLEVVAGVQRAEAATGTSPFRPAATEQRRPGGF